MEQTRPEPQTSTRNYRPPSSSHSRFNDNTAFRHTRNSGNFKPPRPPKHSLKWRKDHYHYRGNHRPKGPHRKPEPVAKKPNKTPTPEELEEEERKKKLNDTAKKLLLKLKSWSADGNSKEQTLSSTTVSEPIIENNLLKKKCVERTAHTKVVKKPKPKPVKPPTYEVNRESVKDFQSRIQHKLIEEIMQMPRESLQNVLNDPKINPVLELKMSRLVKENKLLIASKLRALAESKMTTETNTQLFVDIDKLIEPVMETDLSVLPFELIKQMENVFQVQFDYAGNTKPQVKVEDPEDLSCYECSTDEDEETPASTTPEESKEAPAPTIPDEPEEAPAPTIPDEPEEPPAPTIPEEPEEAPAPTIPNEPEEAPIPTIPDEPEIPAKRIKLSESPVGSPCEPSPVDTKETQTEYHCRDAITQTYKLNTLYGVPIPVESENSNEPSLREELKAIQTLINKLNERRLMIFLEWSRLNPSGSFLNDIPTRKNFTEMASNGSFNLFDSMKQFFKTRNQNKRRSGKKKRDNKKNTETTPYPHQ